MLMASEKDLVNSDARSDRDLVVLIQNGDDDAATQLFDRYSMRLKMLADQQMSMGLRRLFEPEDIVQSAFRSLFRGVNAGSYCAPEGRSLWSLLAVIAINKVRRKATRGRSVVAESLESTVDDRTSVDVADSLSPEQFESSLREAIESLRPTEQEVVQLRVQGFSVEEISDRLGRSCRTIERTLQGIRGKLAEEIQEDSQEV
jgi:RNA polymerase sigma-70 factor, ECF subfamily